MNARLTAAVTLLIVGMIGGVYWMTAGDAEAQSRNDVREHADNTVREQGVVEAADVLELRCKLPGERTILEIMVADGARVKKGDLLVQLDDSDLQVELQSHRVAVAEAAAAVKQLEHEYERLRESTQAQQVTAELQLKLAKHDREQHVAEDGQFAFELKSIEGEIISAQGRRQALAATLKLKEKLVEREFASESDLIEINSQIAEIEHQIELSESKLQLLKKYVHPTQTVKLDLAVAQSEIQLKSVTEDARMRLKQIEAELKAKALLLELERNRLNEIEKRIDQCVIRAPRDGVVAFPVTGSRRTNVVSLQAGATVRERQPLILMPNLEKLRIRAKVHETRIRRVKPGQSVTIRVDAFPDRSFKGTVTFVGDTPEPGTWPNTDVKNYPVVVTIADPPKHLKIGLTALVEIDVSD